MFLHISDQMTVEEVQERFHDCFPNLKLFFYSVPYRNTPDSGDSFLLNRNDRLEYVRHYHYNGALEIKSWFLAAKVKRDLKELFDLNAHIFRIDANGNLIGAITNEELAKKQ